MCLPIFACLCSSLHQPKQTIEEAILCLDYIDHDFYMFRMADSGKVSLVYRRNHGGFGLIEPDSDE